MAEKDYAKYFKKPDLKQAKQRTGESVHVINYEMPENMANIGKNKKFFIDTYGCQMNVHDSEVIAGILSDLGYTPANLDEEADVIILNTCAIRENAENKVYGELGRLKKLKYKNPNLILGVSGCMPQEEAVVNNILKKYQHVDIVFGTHNLHRLPEYLYDAYMNKEQVIEVWSGEGDIIEHMPIKRDGNIKAWVNIMYGCDEFCTYCIVPYTRGKERSRNPEDILKEIQELAQSGFKEVTLLGQNVNAYGKDFTDRNYGFADLLTDIQKIDIPRVRFTTSHPRDFDDKTIEALSQRKNLCEHVHLPVQSGNNEILKKMNRKYTRETYLELVSKLKKALPDVALTTDIIVGFPNETETQFADTLSLVEAAGFEGAYTFIFSAREGTPAAKMPDEVLPETKKERLDRLNDLINQQFYLSHKKYEGKIVEVLCEGESKNDKNMMAGYTRTNKLVNFKGKPESIGKLVRVKITESKTWHLVGEETDD